MQFKFIKCVIIECITSFTYFKIFSVKTSFIFKSTMKFMLIYIYIFGENGVKLLLALMGSAFTEAVAKRVTSTSLLWPNKPTDE